MTEDCREFRQCRLARMHIQRRRALLNLAAGIGMSAALRLALAQSSAKQGVRVVQGDMRINGKPAEAGTLVRPRDAIGPGNGAGARFVGGEDGFLMGGGSHGELMGPGGLGGALHLVTGKLLGVFGSGGERRRVPPTAPTATRGPGAYIEAEPRRTYFCL